jgi:TonB-dependent starch-binding outer membrane protein SusC
VNGDILDTDDDSLNTDLGSPDPKFTLGFSTGVTYKNFDVSLSLYGMFGQKVLNATAMSMYDRTRFPELNVPDKLFEDNVTSNPTYCGYWVENASFLRLQTLTIGYKMRFPNAGIQNLRVYVSGENLFVLTKYSGLDPEIKIETYDANTGSMSSLLNPGIYRYDVYPRPRILTVGLNLSF